MTVCTEKLGCMGCDGEGTLYIDGDTWCEECEYTDFVDCELCYARIYHSDAFCCDDYANLCKDCYNEHTTVCADCGDRFTGDLDYCEYCVRSKRGDITERLSRKVSDEAPQGKTWAEWADAAALVGRTDFGCGFDCEGQCAGQRREGTWESGSHACCVECAGQVGYLYRVPAEAVAPIADLFDDNDGFWSPTGCRLPAKWRSHICLTYSCISAHRTLSDVQKDLVQLTRRSLCFG